jgi:two-component system chemotaxis sensor kinase CheA
MDAMRQIVLGLEQHGQEPAGDDGVVIAALEAASVAASHALPKLGAPEKDRPALAPLRTLRVPVDVLEDLLRLMSELARSRNQLIQLARASSDSQISAAVQRLSQITSELQAGVMKTRLQPIGTAWATIPRQLRDLAHQLGKKINLKIRGADTELDRQVLELIRDPLMHMLRNSADHGLETPAERRAAGKPEVGQIRLNAYHQAQYIIIEISDDGRGLPLKEIRAKVQAQGLATQAELARMSEDDVRGFIFQPGFSTAQQITPVSGRGIGMDVVKANIERMGGTIDLRSEEGRGTSFTLKIPLTLAMISALIVQAGGERFALPQIGVVELIRLDDSHESVARLERIKGTLMLRLRDRVLPVVSLSTLLRLGVALAECLERYVIVTQVGTHRFCILVDRILDVENITVKPLAPILRHITIFGGNTILDDGSVIMILDPHGLGRGAGIAPEAFAEDEEILEAPPAINAVTKTPLLLFRAGDEALQAVPLGQVMRLEDIAVERIEFAGAAPFVAHRGQSMPLLPMGAHWQAPKSGRQAVLVLSDGDHPLGLMVDEVLDVLDDAVLIQPEASRPAYLGSAEVAGRVAQVIDTGYWLSRAYPDGIAGSPFCRQGA